VTIDALPDQVFTGIVTEIGNSPIQATQGAGTQATNFKVVVTLDDEIPSIRPGFTCTADITTAVREDSLAIPIQAATVREVTLDADGTVIREESDFAPGELPASAANVDGANRSDDDPEELEGVFVARQGKAVFLPVKTGIAGERYFEALSGIDEGELIIIGPFSEVRNLEDGDEVRVIDGDDDASDGRGLFGRFRRASGDAESR
jgi:HlyD family secretion protein